MVSLASFQWQWVQLTQRKVFFTPKSGAFNPQKYFEDTAHQQGLETIDIYR
jgi:hypothetical protein